MSLDFSSLSEERLVVLVQNTGDGAAFSYLAAQHEAALLAFLTRFTGNRTQAEDICQDSLIKAYTKISKFQAKSSFKTWLFSIAYNEFLQSQRKAVSFSRLISAFEGLLQESHEPNVGEGVDVQKALDKLPDNERAAILLSEAYGMSNTEVSTAMNQPLGTVKTYIRRGKETLRKRLATVN